jgi:chemotaxis response regulator CheB
MAKTASASRKNSPFDLILLDWLMPKMPGMEARADLKAEPPREIPVLILSHSPLEGSGDARSTWARLATWWRPTVAQGPVRRNRAIAVVSGRRSDQTLAHELSTQLGIIISYAKLLLEEIDAADPEPRRPRRDRPRLAPAAATVRGRHVVRRGQRRRARSERQTVHTVMQAAESVVHRSAVTDPSRE